MTSATRLLALLPSVVFVACGSPPSPHVAPAPAPREPAPLVALPQPPALPRPSLDAACRMTDDVQFGDVAWKLRTRLDAVPAFIARTGHVTAGLLPSWRTRDDGPVAVVQLENDAVELRALVAAEDLRVVLKTPFVAQSSVIPDGVTDRSVLRIEEGTALLALDLPQRETTSAEVPCEQLGLARRGLDASALLPKARRRASLAPTAQLVLGSAQAASALPARGAGARAHDCDLGARLAGRAAGASSLFRPRRGSTFVPHGGRRKMSRALSAE